MKRQLRAAFLFGVVQAISARERVESGVAFNLFSRRLLADPYPIYSKLQTRDPIHRSRFIKGWVLSRHEDIDAVLRDHRLFGNDRISTQDANLRFNQDEPRSMLYRDPPDHTRLRSLVSKAFTPRAVRALRPRVEKIADDLLDRLNGADSFDVIDAIAYPLPVAVICEMLGVPQQDRGPFREWSNDASLSVEPLLDDRRVARSMDTLATLREYFSDLAHRRRADPGGDLISVLTQIEDEGDSLSHEELQFMLVLLLVAGNETTRNLVGNGVLALLRNPEQLDRLRRDPGLIGPAVEEILRYDSPVQMDGRSVREDTEVAGVPMERGQYLMLLLGAANRDPEVFDDPNVLDVSRERNPHLGFGRGIHHCLGAPLARMEAEIILGKLLERFPDIRLAGTPSRRRQIVLRGLSSLPVHI